MGAIRDIVKKADNTKEVTAEIKENLNVLLSLAETKANLFQEEIEKDLITGKTVDDLTVPITKVVAKEIQYRAITADSTSSTLDEVSKSITTMVSEGGNANSLINGIAKIANTALNTIMGCGEGQEMVKKVYTVVADYPAIVRFDFAFWVRSVKADSIRSHMEKALSCVAYKSAVDITKLAFNDFLTLYGPILRGAFGDDTAKIKEMISESKEIYELFTGNTPNMMVLTQRPYDPGIGSFNQWLELLRLKLPQEMNKKVISEFGSEQDMLNIVMRNGTIG